jgi:hypothetical protein
MITPCARLIGEQRDHGGEPILFAALLAKARQHGAEFIAVQHRRCLQSVHPGAQSVRFSVRSPALAKEGECRVKTFP